MVFLTWLRNVNMEPRSLGTQVTQFEERSRIEFTEIGWSLLSNKTTEFYASLYAETRRECVMRSEGLATNLYSEVDVERAALRLDFQRFVSRRRTQSFFRLARWPVAEQHYVDIFDVGRELRMDELATLDTFIYLQRERLVKWGTLGGVASITQQGIREIEGAMAGKRTAYFPQDIADTV
jgi:hypothetical protein